MPPEDKVVALNVLVTLEPNGTAKVEGLEEVMGGITKLMIPANEREIKIYKLAGQAVNAEEWVLRATKEIFQGFAYISLKFHDSNISKGNDVFEKLLTIIHNQCNPESMPFGIDARQYLIKNFIRLCFDAFEEAPCSHSELVKTKTIQKIVEPLYSKALQAKASESFLKEIKNSYEALDKEYKQNSGSLSFFDDPEKREKLTEIVTKTQDIGFLLGYDAGEK